MPQAVSVNAVPVAASVSGPGDLKGATNGVPPIPATAVPDIIDIRRSLVESDLKTDVLSMFNPSNGPRRLPTLLLYNERGLQLFEDVGHFL